MKPPLYMGLDHAKGPDQTVRATVKIHRSEPMMEFLITDMLTTTRAWVQACCPRQALIKRENELRADPKEGKWRFSQTPLPESTPADVWMDTADMMDMGVADVRLRGPQREVVREARPKLVVSRITGIGGVTL